MLNVKKNVDRFLPWLPACTKVKIVMVTSAVFLTIVCTLGLAPLVLDPKVTGNGLAVTEDVCT